MFLEEFFRFGKRANIAAIVILIVFVPILFGNEGGARHIVHAMGRPSLVICSPSASKATWLPQDTDITAIGLSASDIRPDAATLTPREQYDLITVDRLWPLLRSFCEGLQETPKL